MIALQRMRSSGQAGFTMIELMVAVALAGLLMAGLMQVYIATKQAYLLHDNLSRMQEGGRFAVQFFNRYLSMGGMGLSRASSPTDFTDNGANTADDAVSALFSASNLPGTIPECDGSGNYNGTTAAYIAVDTSVGITGLGCDTSVGGATAQVLSYLVNIRTAVGTTPTIDPDTPANNRFSWRTSTQWDSEGQLDDIFAVRVAFLMRSHEQVLLENQSRTYTLLDGQITKNDRYLYQPYTITIPLRSRGL